MARNVAGLAGLAESLADGASVDWPAAENLASDDDRAIIAQLRVLAALAVVHRRLPIEPQDLPSGSLPRRTNTQPAIGNWAHFTLLDRIGGGTFGDVYRAWDRHLERDVALKLLKIDESLGDPNASLAAREGRLLARVRHPSVITVHGVAVHEQRVGLWMELIRGVTLEEKLRTEGPLSAREATLLGIDLCQALAAIHAAGLIHRDIKAQNVMREDGGRVVLMDMGTGCELAPDSRGATSAQAGTPLYLAPEIFQGQSAGFQSDIYSLGVLLYHLVTGSYPVRAATIDELYGAHRSGRRTRLRDARADLPTKFVGVIDRATAPNRQDRYGSAGAFEADLAQALDAGSTPDPPPTPRPRIATIAATIAVVIALSWSALSFRSSSSGAPTAIRSVAVLPLVNLSRDPSQEYFADGMTDELISMLGHLNGLNVISRTSVMRYKGTQARLPDIARALGVDAVLEGSVLVLTDGGAGRESDKRIRINARLIHAGTDTHLWNRTFERRGGDVFALQNEIARAVTEGIDFRRGADSAVRAHRAQDFNVFDLYLRGRYYWNMRSEEGFRRSIQYFQEAIKRDPQYAAAYAGLADAYNLLGDYAFMRRDEAISRARAAALTALDLDTSLGEAHASLGHLQANQLDGDAAEASFKQAIALAPGYATAHHWYAIYLAQRGRLDEALTQIQTALSLDPLSPSVSGAFGAILLYAHRNQEAIDRLQTTLRFEPNFAKARMILADAFAADGKYESALEESQRALALRPEDPELRADLAYTFTLVGRHAEASRIARDLEERFEQGNDAEPVAIALVYANLADHNKAFAWLDVARRVRDPWLGYLRVDGRFAALHGDPRFEDLLRSIGLAR